MTDEPYDSTTLRRAIREAFGVALEIKEIVVRKLPTGYASEATVFLTTSGLYVFVASQGNMLQADVRKMMRVMNVDVEAFIPPHGDAEYFKRIGTQKFKEIFPGKHIMSDDDIRYYQTLAPYNPALVKVERVKGDIRGFHFESKSWRKVREYTYSRISLG